MPLEHRRPDRMSATTRSVAKVNAGLILDALRDGGAMSRREVVQATGLSRATVNRLTETLIAGGSVVDDQMAQSTGGRPARVLRYNGQRQSVLAFDVGSKNIVGALVDMDARVVHREVRPTVDARGILDPKDVYNRLLALAVELIDIARPRYPVQVVAVSVPGRIEGGLVEFAPALQWWSMPLGSLLEEQLNLPVLVENDVNLVALVEHRRGAGAGCPNMVAVTLGTGVGAGLVLDGRLHRGWLGSAGELGYLLVEPRSVEQAWPGFGDLESRIGAVGIERRAAALGLHGSPADGRVAPPTVAEVLRAAESGDAAARELARELTDEIAVAIGNISVIVAPEVIVITGDVGRAAASIVRGVSSRLQGRIPAVPRVVPGQINDPELVGAAELAMEHALSKSSLRLS